MPSPYCRQSGTAAPSRESNTIGLITAASASHTDLACRVLISRTSHIRPGWKETLPPARVSQENQPIIRGNTLATKSIAKCPNIFATTSLRHAKNPANTAPTAIAIATFTHPPDQWAAANIPSGTANEITRPSPISRKRVIAYPR